MVNRIYASIIILGLSAQFCHAGIMITSFTATDEENSAVWQGFGFSVSDSVTVTGFGIIDFDDEFVDGVDDPNGADSTFVAAEARLWSIGANAGEFSELAVGTFGSGNTESLLVDEDNFLYGGTDENLKIFGFRAVEFNGSSVLLTPGVRYVIAARSTVDEEELAYFQSVTGGTFPGMDVTTSSPFNILSSEDALAGFTATGASERTDDHYGLQGMDATFGFDAPPYNSIATDTFAFNPIVVTLLTGTLEENEEEYSPPTDPIVPEPSSAVLMGLGILCGLGVYRRRRAA